MKVIDFFCGAGGFSEGFRQAGFDTVCAVDKWLPAVKTYKINKPKAKTILDDVLRISLLPDKEFDELIPDTEIILGSPPCVAFSNSNKSGKGDKTLGIQLLEAYLRIVARKKFKKGSILKYWILENVPNLQNFVKDKYTAKDLGLKGDFVLCPIGDSSGIYNARNYGAPTNRKRFLCGEFPKPLETHSDQDFIPLKKVISSLDKPYSPRSRILDCNYTDFELPSDQVTDCHYKYILQPFEWERAKRLKLDKGYMGKMAFPEDVNKIARTVMATMSSSSRESMILGCPDGNYRLPTVREVASIMGFPIDYRFYGVSKGIKYTLVGNAVSPKLSYALAKAIAENNKLKIPSKYLPISHDNSIDFCNLNGMEPKLKEEKPKRPNANFKDHIPYLIINRYRVELTNMHSNFILNMIKWNAEIHYGQGKKMAKILAPMPQVGWFSNGLYSKIKIFIDGLEKKLNSPTKTQEIYCMTEKNRTTKKVLGPVEILEFARQFIDKKLTKEQKNELISIDKSTVIPLPILVGYFILNKITVIIEKYEN